MKKLLFGCTFALLLVTSACSSVKHTATVVPVATEVHAISNADLKVSPVKISYTYIPTKAVKRTGEDGVISTAVAQALKEYGKADVLVGFQYEIKKTRNLFGVQSIKYVIVEGYPATYTNIMPVKIRK